MIENLRGVEMYTFYAMFLGILGVDLLVVAYFLRNIFPSIGLSMVVVAYIATISAYLLMLFVSGVSVGSLFIGFFGVMYLSLFMLAGGSVMSKDDNMLGAFLPIVTMLGGFVSLAGYDLASDLFGPSTLILGISAVHSLILVPFSLFLSGWHDAPYIA